MGPEDMEKAFDAIATLFPNVESITFFDECMIYVGGLQRMRKRMLELERVESCDTRDREESFLVVGTWRSSR